MHKSVTTPYAARTGSFESDPKAVCGRNREAMHSGLGAVPTGRVPTILLRRHELGLHGQRLQTISPCHTAIKSNETLKATRMILAYLNYNFTSCSVYGYEAREQP
jgi:hypothetical protein